MAYSFTSNDDFNFRIQTMLGGVYYGLGDVGEILATVSKVPDGDDRAWAKQFGELAERVERSAKESKDPRSSAEAHLRAAVYFAARQDAEVTYASDEVILRTFHNHRRCWDAFAEAVGLEQVSIPYPEQPMPGYFAAAGTGPAPTVVIINGSDGALTWVWTLARAALDRGYNALMFDGPGQQSMLFEHKIPFRPDWEAVITPVVDLLLSRPDVDPDRLVLWGGSQGGYWAPRALAFEHRFAAGVADPGVIDVGQAWLGRLPPGLIQLLDSGDRKDFDAAMSGWMQDPATAATWKFRARPYGTFDPFEVFSAMRQYDLTDVAGQITTPLMICDPEGEQFWPGQAEKLAHLVKGPVELEKFTAAEGADMHCEPMARSLVYQRMFDWLAGVLA
ncbi:MAG TPA: alpha/beta fold hydrolase [Actinomycetota bacterium]|nr:alpha/beta fold hydrolase [Actinomycetota bacterium]